MLWERRGVVPAATQMLVLPQEQGWHQSRSEGLQAKGEQESSSQQQHQLQALAKLCS